MYPYSEEFNKLKLDEVIAEGSSDFEDWTKLISYVEQIHHVSRYPTFRILDFVVIVLYVDLLLIKSCVKCF